MRPIRMNKKKRTLLLAMVCLGATFASVYGLYSVADSGQWPESWPKELEPLRAKSATFIGPTFEARHYHIPFSDREEFEAAWPHLLKMKTVGAPVILLKSPYNWVGHIAAGVIVHAPPASKEERAEPPVVTKPGDSDSPRSNWRNGNYIELFVDGKVVDLNRIKLPGDGQIIDERFRKDPASDGGKAEK